MGVESETPEVAWFVSQQHACHSCGVTSLHFINPGQRGYERKREEGWRGRKGGKEERREGEKMKYKREEEEIKEREKNKSVSLFWMPYIHLS